MFVVIGVMSNNSKIALYGDSHIAPYESNSGGYSCWPCLSKWATWAIINIRLINRTVTISRARISF